MTFSGGLLIDKPLGPTSHDVVQRIRRSLSTRRVGHAGTLDPFATGLLVVLVGEATKLEPYVSASDKTYVARVVLGRTTDTLDLESTRETTLPVPDDVRAEIERLGSAAAAHAPRLEAALEAEQLRTAQDPPSFSAIKVDGVRSYARARAGLAFVLPARPVRVRRITMREVGFTDDGCPFVDVELEVSKGYYVRAFARDLAATLGTVGALGALRRTRSGIFDVAKSLAPDADPEQMRSSLIPLGALARRALPALELTGAGVVRARHGKLLSAASDMTAIPPGSGPFALMAPGGEALVAVAISQDDGARILRGFVSN